MTFYVEGKGVVTLLSEIASACAPRRVKAAAK
jgi:hypothetical protein